MTNTQCAVTWLFCLQNVQTDTNYKEISVALLTNYEQILYVCLANSNLVTDTISFKFCVGL